MQIRKSNKNDIPRIMELYDISRKYMREMGNLNQWTNGYPQISVVENDIKKGNSYVYCEDSGIIQGTFYFGIEEDPTYNKIYDGNWLNDKPYGVIHRLAVGINKKGIASRCFNLCFSKIGNIKVDTHKDNIPMRNLLQKQGYTYCGIIYLLNGDERLAFQKCSEMAL